MGQQGSCQGCCEGQVGVSLGGGHRSQHGKDFDDVVGYAFETEVCFMFIGDEGRALYVV